MPRRAVIVATALCGAVTTVFRGVFFGYAADTAGEQIALTDARSWLHRYADVRFFTSLATHGPSTNCRIGPRADFTVQNVTTVLDVTPEAVTRWEAASWRRVASAAHHGAGYWEEAYWRAVLAYAVAALPPEQRARADTLRDAGAVLAFWRSDSGGQSPMPRARRSHPPVSPGMVQRERGPLKRRYGCGRLHASLTPLQWFGQRWWIVAMSGDVRTGHGQLSALQREILAEFRG